MTNYNEIFPYLPHLSSPCPSLLTYPLTIISLGYTDGIVYYDVFCIIHLSLACCCINTRLGERLLFEIQIPVVNPFWFFPLKIIYDILVLIYKILVLLVRLRLLSTGALWASHLHYIFLFLHILRTQKNSSVCIFIIYLLLLRQILWKFQCIFYATLWPFQPIYLIFFRWQEMIVLHN